jgi:superfamily I DNA/RNA helicase
MSESRDEIAEMEARRAAASAAIVDSKSPKRLIVAGPGTGKSFTFRQALEVAGGNGLALTFIRNLVVDLEKDLGNLADVNTLHGFCKHLMHRFDVAGLQSGDYYPPLMQLVVDDLLAITGSVVRSAEIEKCLHTLDYASDLIDEALAVADYYNAVAHTDLVFRILGHFEASPESIPSYPLIVVDEFQDFSPLEIAFIRLLAEHNPVLIAGDDDQALYTQLRYASPQGIRTLAAEGDFERHTLPYCSRCPSVIVESVNRVIANAAHPACGNLEGRLDKEFSCYLPGKAKDSAANPTIIHVKCSTAHQPYAGEYIVQQIGRIPAEDISSSASGGYPTVLVIGSRPFIDPVFKAVSASFPQARRKPPSDLEVELLDGYRRIIKDENSRLGWRIVVACCLFDGDMEAVRSAVVDQHELVDLLPEDYVTEQRELANFVARLLDRAELAPDEQSRLEQATKMSLEAILEFLQIEDPDDRLADGNDLALAPAQPDILFTSMLGSKGLSAEHVFIVGLNDEYLPRKRAAVTDDEVCRFVVALSRTRKRCHVISFAFFGKPLKPSRFLTWIKPNLSAIKVNKDYDFSD